MTRKNRGPASGEHGQATVEFALTLVLLMAFILFYLQLSLVFAWGNFVHYATFMSARAYLAGGPDQEDQKERAKNVITHMVKRSSALAGVDRLPTVARGVGGGDVQGFEADAPSQFNATDRDSSWMEGVRYTFRSRVFLIPFGRTNEGQSGAPGTSVNSVTLTSESWLGREPSYGECVTEMGRFPAIWDNGC